MTDFESTFALERLVMVLDSLLEGHFDVIVERHRITTGADRVDLDLFLRDRDLHLATASQKVLQGRYTFGPYLERQIPKPGSKKPRTISIASIRDSVVQRAMYGYLYPGIDAMLSPSVFGYRKGCSAHGAVRAIRHHFAEGRVFVFDADLQEFFDSVNHDVLLEMIGRLAVDDRAKVLIRRFLKTGRIPSTQVEQHRARKGMQSRFVPEARKIGVPQGGVLSGLLSNFYLSQFDAAIRTLHPGYVRYADDFLVCCHTEEECQQVHGLVREELKPLRLTLHPTKTVECVSGERGVNFLGFRISTRGVRARGRNVTKFKTRIRDVVATQKVYATAEKTLRSLVW